MTTTTETATATAFDLAVVGPTRVGKTSLVATLLKDGQRLLTGTPLEMRARTTRTEARISEHRRELQGSLYAGEFRPGALKGSVESFTFELSIDAGGDPGGIHLNVYDYPGSWLDPARRESEEEWQRARSFITHSSVLLVPIDAAVLMEAARPADKADVPSILTVPEVEDVARSWANERARRRNEPALLVLCPLKCESYFADNGGLTDRSGELHEAVLDVYHETIDAVRSEAPHVQILLCPIDTIGCVQLVAAEFSRDEYGAGFSARYRIRPPRKLVTRGADDLLVVLLQQLVKGRHDVLRAAAGDARSTAAFAQDYAARDEGFFRGIFYAMNGEWARRDFAAMRASDVSAQATRRESEVFTVLETLTKRDLGPRASWI